MATVLSFETAADKWSVPIGSHSRGELSLQLERLMAGRLIFPSKEGLSAGDLLRLLEGACFSASPDSDADSWETQNNRFLADAREIATSLLEGEDAALIERTRAILSDQVQWFVPEGRRLFASIDRARLDVRFEPALSDPPEAVVPNPADDRNP